MTRRHYVNNAPHLTLASSITSGATSCTVSGTFAGYPASFPFYVTLDLGQLSEEIVLVTNIVGTTATITRAQDGTAAVSHTAGAGLDFTVGAIDFDEANAHVNATTGVHGVSGSVVGSSDVQTLTNKTLTSPAVNGATVSGTWTGTIAAAGLTLTSPILSSPAVTNGVHTGDATHAAVTAQAGASGTRIASFKDSGAVERTYVDQAGNVTAPTVSTALVPRTFTNEAAATAAIPAPTAQTIIWLTAPTGGAVAGPYYWTGAAWAPLTPGFLYGDTTTGANITLSTTSAFASSASVTFTLPAQRRVKIEILSAYQAATVPAHPTVRAGYNAGATASIGSFVSVGQAAVNTVTVAGASGAASQWCSGTVLLPAGQYTAYQSITRSGGGVSDVAALFYVGVFDAGPV